jgi:hypothetical protein
VLPKIGPLRGLQFKVPTPETEKMFEASFNAAARLDRRSFAEIRAGALKLSNLDLDTGRPVSPGEYQLTDRTYDRLLKKLADNKFADASPELREDILRFYGAMSKPDPHGIDEELAELKARQARSSERPAAGPKPRPTFGSSSR